MRLTAIVLPMVLLAGCQDGESQPQATLAATDAAAAAETTPAEPASPVAKAVAVKDSNALYEFEYAYPAEAAAIPALKAQFDAEMDKARAAIEDAARDGRQAAKESGFDYNPYSSSMTWSVVTDLPGWLSLSSQVYEFTGGAHGNSGTSGLLWDRAAGRSREPLALFVSKTAFDAALRDRFCALLNKERGKRRGEPVRPGSTESFDECLDPSSLTVLLGSSDRQHFNRIGIVADPYAAGPYAEGSYEVTLPVTPAVIQAVKPEYRAAFAAAR